MVYNKFSSQQLIFPKISTEFGPSRGYLCVSEVACSSLATLLRRLWKATNRCSHDNSFDCRCWFSMNQKITWDTGWVQCKMGHVGHGYWPVTHVTHPNLLTHLTYDPLIHCQLCRHRLLFSWQHAVIYFVQAWKISHYFTQYKGYKF